MLVVNNQQINDYNGNSVHKIIRINFPKIALELTNDRIYESSMKLSESLIQGKNIEFVGCISSEFQIQVQNVPHKLKGTPIEVYIKTENTEEIPLFKGYVDSAKMQTNRSFKLITAYDALYKYGQKNVAEWYNKLTFPITLGDLRKSLFNHIGLAQENVKLPNDWLSIEKKYEPKDLKCLTVIKNICQINGCFGIMNRQGVFTYKILQNSYERTYPDLLLFPSSSLYLAGAGGSSGIANDFPFYKQVNYEEFSVKPVERLQIRQTSKDAGITVGAESGNKYIIQNNMFARDVSEENLRKVAKNIFNSIKEISFHPCDTNNNGLPYVEVGDVVTYAIPTNAYTTPNEQDSDAGYDVNKFFVMSRELSGIQALRDRYSADGEEEQSEFITDLQTQIDTIQDNGGGGVPEDVYTKEEVDSIIDNIETPTGFKVVSCDILPPKNERDADTIYLVRGDIVLID